MYQKHNNFSGSGSSRGSFSGKPAGAKHSSYVHPKTTHGKFPGAVKPKQTEQSKSSFHSGTPRHAGVYSSGGPRQAGAFSGGGHSGGYRSGPRSGGSFSSGGPRRSGGFSGGGSRRPGFSGGGQNRFRGNSRPRFEGEKMHYSRFINKAVVTEQTEVFVPVNKFADFAIDEKLKANIIAHGYVTPTPIQDKIIPHILGGADVVGIANTGTGKTAAFLIPLMQKVILNPREKIMIIVPTRELAIQIDQEFRSFRGSMEIYSVCCVGGAPIGRQMSELRYHNSFVIGTPGRLKDLMQRGMIKTPQFSTIVLDEADRMLDMGFIHDMKFIMEKMPTNRHTLFFSATMDKQIEVLIKDFLRNPVTVSVKTGNTAQSVEQDIVKVLAGTNKIDVLHDLLVDKAFSKVLIFGRTKHGVEKLSNELEKRGFKSQSIHGDKNHNGRQRALGLFKDNLAQVLVATDVAARGLDIPNVSHVINYDLPATYEDYVHRIGRTGRAGKKGMALTFVDHR